MITKISTGLFLFSFLFNSSVALAIDCPAGSESSTRTTESGKVEECLSITDKSPNGPRMDYDKKGNLIRSWNFKAGLPDGEFKVFDGKKNLLRQGQFNEGRLQGKMFRWYEKGRLQDETNWINGRPQGLAKRYHKNGKVMETGNYQAGRRIGVWNFNKANGSVLPSRNYGAEYAGQIELQEFDATVKTLPSSKFKLNWKNNADVEKKTLGGITFLSARVEMEAPEKGWKVQFGEQEFFPWDLEEKKITLDVPLSGRLTKVNAKALGPVNNSESFEIEISSNEPELKIVEPELPVASKSVYLKASIGLSQNSYSEGSAIKGEFSNLEVAGNISYPFSGKNYELFSSLIYDVSVLSKSSDDRSLQFLQYDAGLRYWLTQDNESFRFGVLGGFSYKTSNGTDFGMKNISGLVFSPSLRYKLSEAQSLLFSFRYVPLFVEKLSFNPSSEAETLVDVAWSKRLNNKSYLNVRFYTSTLKISRTNTDISQKRNGISVGYEF